MMPATITKPRSLDRVPALDRLVANVEYLMTRGGEVTATDPAQPFQVQRDSRTVLPNNPWKMRVYQVGAQNIPDNSSVVQGHIAYDTVSYDTSNAFDAVNHQWVAPLDGYYLIAAEVGFTLPAIANAVPRWELGVYVNGVASEWGPLGIFTQPNPGIAYFMSASVTESLFLNKGDTVFIDIANVNGGGVWPVTADSQHTYWSMHLIST